MSTSSRAPRGWLVVEFSTSVVSAKHKQVLLILVIEDKAVNEITWNACGYLDLVLTFLHAKRFLLFGKS